jgi:uncharacterized protein DUF4239
MRLARTFAAHRQREALLSAFVAWFGTLAITVMGILVGVFLRHTLPKRYFNKNTTDTVKLCAGVIATLAALTLGLLIASAKASYDARVTQIRQIAANLILSDRLLTLYGEEGKDARSTLRVMVPLVTDQIWSENQMKGPQSYHAVNASEEYVNRIYEMKPKNDFQRNIRERVLATALEMGRARLSLFSQLNSVLPPPLLVVLAIWFAVLFIAYTMYAEINVVSLIALLACAISVSAAMYLLYQMNNPFSGIMAIPKIDLVAMMPPI